MPEEVLRVALVAGTLARGGAERQAAHVARALAEEGAWVRVFTLDHGGALDRELAARGVATTWVGRSPHPAVRVAALTAALASFRPHVVHATHFYVNLHAALAARACGTLAVGSIRNDLVHELADVGRWGLWSLRAPAALVANSADGRAAALRLGVPSRRVRVLRNVLDLAELDRRAAAPPDAPRPTAGALVAIGRLVPQKRLDRFLELVADVRRERPDVRALVVGDGPERAELEDRARALGLDDAVAFLGQRDDVAAILRRSAALVLTSAHEGSPNVVLEAMALGVPVVTTAVGEARRLVRDGRTGFVVEPDDREGLRDRVLQLLVAPALRAQLGAAGRARVAERHTLAGQARRVRGIWRALAREIAGAPARRLAAALDRHAGRSRAAA